MRLRPVEFGLDVRRAAPAVVWRSARPARPLGLRPFVGAPPPREPVPAREPVPLRDVVAECEPLEEPGPVKREPLAVLDLPTAPPADRILATPALAPPGPTIRPLPEAIFSSISPLLLSRPGRAKTRAADHGTGLSNDYPGDVLLSQGAAPQVPSALVVLTSVFGMGTGVAPPLWSPGTFALFGCRRLCSHLLLEPSIASTSLG